MRNGLVEFNPEWLRREMDVRLWSAADLARSSGLAVTSFQRAARRGRMTRVGMTKVLRALRENDPLPRLREVVEQEFGPVAETLLRSTEG